MKAPLNRFSPKRWIAAALLGSACLSLSAPCLASGPGHAAATHQGHNAGPMKAQHERHLQALKSKLQLSPEQESAWTAFTAAMTPLARGAHSERQAQRAELAALSTPERIDRMRVMREQRQAEMNARADRRGEAAKALYASLRPEQRKVFDDETARLMRQHGEHGHRAGRHG